MNENTAHPNSNCQADCDSQKAKDKHNEDMKRADQQKNKDSADKKAEKAPGQQA